MKASILIRKRTQSIQTRNFSLSHSVHATFTVFIWLTFSGLGTLSPKKHSTLGLSLRFNRDKKHIWNLRRTSNVGGFSYCYSWREKDTFMTQSFLFQTIVHNVKCQNTQEEAIQNWNQFTSKNLQRHYYYSENQESEDNFQYSPLTQE